MKKNLVFIGMAFMLFLTACTSSETTLEIQQGLTEETVEESVNPKMDITDISETEKEIYFYRDDLKIYGKMYLPEGEGPFPVVIFSHGFPGTHFWADVYAKELTNRGLAGVTFDFIGGSSESKSDGDVTEMSVLTEAQDLNVVIDSVKTMPWIDVNNLFLLGHSFGGLVSTYVAAQRPDDVKGLMVWEPSYQMSDEILKLYPQGCEIPDEIYTPSHVGRIFIEDLQNLDIYETMGNYDKEILLLQGELSKTNELQDIYFNKAAETFPNMKWEIVDGANHTFSEKSGERALEKCIDYMMENME